MMNEICIYLESHTLPHKEMGTMDVCFDFCREEDLKDFLELTHLPEQEGSFVRVMNYVSPRRLNGNRYYSLNQQLLQSKLVIKRVVEDAEDGTFGYELDFRRFNEADSNNVSEKVIKKITSSLCETCRFIRSNRHRQKIQEFLDKRRYDDREILDEDICLFLPHDTPIDELRVLAEGVNKIPENQFSFDGKMSVKVNNVGQANSNELLVDDKVEIVYDFGSPLFSPRGTVAKHRKMYYPQYEKDHPYLVISHWDLDHYRCLCGMTIRELSVFSGAACNNLLNSLTSQRLLKKIQNAIPKTSVFEPQEAKPSPQVFCKHQSPTVSLYMGNNSDVNTAGILMCVKGDTGTAIYSGDARYDQINDVFVYEPICSTKPNHVLIVPHHGGGNTHYPGLYQQQLRQINSTCAIISVGATNAYGHPENRAMNYLSLCFKNIKRTDLLNQDIVVAI